MKKLSLLLVSMIFMLSLFAGEWIKIKTDQSAQATTTLVSSTNETTIVKFDVPGFFLDEVITPNGKETTIRLDNASPILEKGDPDLMKLTTSVMIPDHTEMGVEILTSVYKEYTNINIAPSKGNFTRDIDPSTVPYTYGKSYQQDQFFPGKLAELREPYILRDYRGQTIIVYPFQYNPVTKVLRVYSEMEVKIEKTGNNGLNPLTKTKKPETINAQFNEIYTRQFLNYGNLKYTPVDEEGGMLIISYNSFMSAMTDFVNWKKTIGIPVQMVDVATIGNAAAIKTYIANYYNTHDLAYVLLVGDAAQVPSSYASGDSDNNYTYIVGSDHYPDIFIGRFSAESVAHVQTQVQRTIEYEQSPYTGMDWFTKNIGIASAEGPGDDGEYDYQHIRNQQTDLMNYTYTYNYELFDGSQGGNDAAGNPTTAMVATNINSGSSIILYTGHGSNTSWASSGFSNTNVAALTNTQKLPFIWSVACVNGNFVGTTCFAEAWMRSTYNNQPVGAIATLMSTINQSWNPPMEGQDEMVDILVESYSNNIKRTFGGLSMNGCMKMNDTYGADGAAMTDTWNLFGDPSVVVRTAMPQNLTVSHNPTIFLGATQFTVFANKQGAKVCLTVNNEIIGTGIISGGSATITFPALTTVGTLKVAVTAYNYIPYIGNVTITPASGPYLGYHSHQINDNGGNNNGQIDFGESILLSVAINNIGSAAATNVNVTLQTADPYVSITDNTAAYGSINAGQTISIPNGFAFNVAANVPDNHPILFTLQITSSEGTWQTNLNEIAYAPAISGGSNISINDASGNNNNRLDPGETAIITIVVYNNGHSASPTTNAILTSVSPYITVISGTISLGTISAGGSANASFSITCSPSTPIGQSVDLTMNVTSGSYGFNQTYYTSVGLVLEDWETGNFAQFPWTFGGNAAWTITNVSPYEGIYSAKSGTITHSQTSDLIVQLYVSQADIISFYRKVSSESSYDYLRFFIDGVQQAEWAGELAWAQFTYPVTAGQHTFMWRYFKDASVSSGSDCAWIDYITFPTVIPPPDPPQIALSPLSFDVSLPVDASQVKELAISNTGEETLSYSITKTYIFNDNSNYSESIAESDPQEQATNLLLYYEALNQRIAAENPVKVPANDPTGSGPTDALCTPSFTYGCSYADGFTDFAVEQIQNLGNGCANNAGTGWSVYHNLGPALFTSGQTYAFGMRTGYSNQYVNIWIDFNNDDVLSADERILTNYNLAAVSTWYYANVTIPINAVAGLHKMRVMAVWQTTFTDPCGSYAYGEAEDYTVLINSPMADWLTINPISGTVVAENLANIALTFNSADLEIGTYIANVIVSSNDPVTPSVIVPCTLNVTTGLNLNLKAMLEGPVNGSIMSTTINSMLPLSQPYNMTPWDYTGTEAVASMPNNVVDWVLVELRDATSAANATSATRIARQAGLLLSDGSIVSTDGSSYLQFSNSISQQLFVVVHHRNHLGILSANAVLQSGGIYTYDFSTGYNKTYGGMAGCKEVGSGIWGMIGGDSDCNGIIQPADIDELWKPYAGNAGYHGGDFNLDGQIDNKDKDDCWQSNYDMECQVP